MTSDNWNDPRFAEDWDLGGNLTTNPDRANQISLLADLLAASEPLQLIDLGIGSAQVESAINRRHPGFFGGCRVTGIDASEAMLALAARRCEAEGLEAVELVRGDFAALNAIDLDEAPDAVICVQALHEVKHDIKRAVFGWVRQRLPAGRPFLILDRFAYPAGQWLDDWRAIWNWMRSEAHQEVLDFDAYHRRYRAKDDHVATVEDYREWLEEAGFETTCPYLCFNRALIVARS